MRGTMFAVSFMMLTIAPAAMAKQLNGYENRQKQEMMREAERLIDQSLQKSQALQERENTKISRAEERRQEREKRYNKDETSTSNAAATPPAAPTVTKPTTISEKPAATALPAAPALPTSNNTRSAGGTSDWNSTDRTYRSSWNRSGSDDTSDTGSTQPRTITYGQNPLTGEPTRTVLGQ